MSNPRIKERLQDMLTYSQEVIAIMHSKTRRDLDVDLDIIWQVVTQDLPKLTETLIEILEKD